MMYMSRRESLTIPVFFGVAVFILFAASLMASQASGDGADASSRENIAKFNIVMPQENRTQTLNASSYSAFYGLDVKNVGDQLAAAHLDMIATPVGWEWQLNCGAFTKGSGTANREEVIESVWPGESRTCSLTIFAPLDEGAGDFMLILQVTPSGPDFQVAITSTIQQKGGVFLYPPSDAQAMPGDLVNLKYLIENNGNGEDSFQVTRVDIGLDWERKYDDGSNMTKGKTKAHATTTKTVQVQVPYEAEATKLNTPGVRVSITVTSVFDPTKEDSKGCYIFIKQKYDIKLDLQPMNYTVELGRGENNAFESYVFNFILKNRGNGWDNVSIRADYSLADWAITLSNDYFNLSMGTSRQYQLSVQPSAKTLKGEYYLSVSVESEGPPGNPIILTQPLVIIVKDWYGISMDCTSSFIGDLRPGDLAMYECIVENKGNANDYIEMESSNVPDGWSVTFDPNSLTLQPTQKRVVTTNILVSVKNKLAAAGIYPIEVNASSSNDPDAKMSITLNITIGNYYNIDFYIGDTDEQIVNPFKVPRGAFTFRLLNTGNCKEDVLLSIVGTSWEGDTNVTISAKFDFTNKTLNAFEDTIVGLAFTVPLSTPLQQYFIEVQATAAHNPEATRRLKVHLEVISEDVMVQPLRFRKTTDTNFKEVPIFEVFHGDKLHLEIKLKNMGNIDTTPIKISVFEKRADGTRYNLIWNTTIETLPKGQTKTLIVVWPQSLSDSSIGEKDIRVTASLDGDAHGGDNEATGKIKVVEKKVDGTSNIGQRNILTTFFWLFVLLLIVAIAFVARYMVRLRKEQTSMDLYESIYGEEEVLGDEATGTEGGAAALPPITTEVATTTPAPAMETAPEAQMAPASDSTGSYDPGAGSSYGYSTYDQQPPAEGEYPPPEDTTQIPPSDGSGQG